MLALMVFSIFILVGLPKLYEKLFKNKDFSYIFSFNQVIFFIAGLLHMSLALRMHEKDGIPSELFFNFIGNVMENAEKSSTLIPTNTIISLVCPKGIESSMQSLKSSIVVLNMYLIKGLVGVLINKIFVGAEEKKIEEKLW